MKLLREQFGVEILACVIQAAPQGVGEPREAQVGGDRVQPGPVR
jgi:hypothetical protein